MPSRLASLAILVAWMAAATALFLKDVLPVLVIGPPPDLRSVSQADEQPRQTRWNLIVVDGEGMNLRTVGQAVTRTVLQKDRFTRVTSEAWLDTHLLLQGTRLEMPQGERQEINGSYEVDPGGNLYHFRATVRDGAFSRTDLVTIEGQQEENSIVVRAKGYLPIMNWEKRLPYQPRGMIQNALGPLDRMPGLHVGQRWRTEVVNPLDGQVTTAEVEVKRECFIPWDGRFVTTREVVTRASLFSVRTWVRPDGLVLRQEVPFPLVRLALERVPDRETERNYTP